MQMHTNAHGRVHAQINSYAFSHLGARTTFFFVPFLLRPFSHSFLSFSFSIWWADETHWHKMKRNYAAADAVGAEAEAGAEAGAEAEVL